MLDHEYNVEEYGEIAKCKLDGIASDARPVVLQIAVDS